MKVQHFYDPNTYTLTYVVIDTKTKDAIVIDPVMDFEQASGALTNKSAKDLISFIREEELNLIASLETHAHADHLSGSQLLKKEFPNIQIGISEKIKIVQEVFKKHFNIDYVNADGSQFDLLLKDNEVINFGSIKLKALPTPGHTPACMSFLVDDKYVFTGDALFMPDYGTGRCDFPKGSAKDLYHSIANNLYTLNDDVEVYVGHDYQPNGRELLFKTTIGESKRDNIQLKSSTSENEYIEFRESRDKTLSAPKLLLPSIQINIDAGHLPPKEDNKVSYLKLPLSEKFE